MHKMLKLTMLRFFSTPDCFLLERAFPSRKSNLSAISLSPAALLLLPFFPVTPPTNCAALVVAVQHKAFFLGIGRVT